MIPTVSPQFDPLLDDVSSFERRFRRALGDGRRLDRVRGFGGPSNPYDDFAPTLGRLFERTRQAFDQEKMELARDAYAGLFALLALRDDYGFAITRPEGLVIRDDQARYLRAIGQTATPEKRSVLVIQTKRLLAQSLWEGCDLSIQTLLEIAPLRPHERDECLDELICRLDQIDEPGADRWGDSRSRGPHNTSKRSMSAWPTASQSCGSYFWIPNADCSRPRGSAFVEASIIGFRLEHLTRFRISPANS